LSLREYHGPEVALRFSRLIVLINDKRGSGISLELLKNRIFENAYMHSIYFFYLMR